MAFCVLSLLKLHYKCHVLIIKTAFFNPLSKCVCTCVSISIISINVDNIDKLLTNCFNRVETFNRIKFHKSAQTSSQFAGDRNDDSGVVLVHFAG